MKYNEYLDMRNNLMNELQNLIDSGASDEDYTAKAGMTEEEALEMMEHETWLTAQQAKDKGLIDEIMFEEPEALPMTASSGLFRLPTADQMDRVRAMMKEEETPSCEKPIDAIRRNREADRLRLACGRKE